MRAFALVVASSILCWQSGWAAPTDDVSLEGGVCSDDPFVIVQKSGRSADGQDTFERIEFSGECKVLGVDKLAYQGNDQPPLSFSCHQGGASRLSGATYKKIRNTIIKEEETVDTRVYVYNCVKGCAHAPKKLEYTLADCG